MNDPIKDFVEQHREEFDHLEAPRLNLNKLKANIHPLPQQKVKLSSGFHKGIWMAAASVMIAIALGWLFFNRDSDSKNKDGLTAQLPADRVNNTPKTSDKADAPVYSDTLSSVSNQRQLSVENKKRIAQPKVSSLAAKTTSLASLQDSSSASSRLLAILEMEKAGKINNASMNRLAETLNNDGNTNVRLAALSLMEKYSDNSYVSGLLINSLTKQSDPMVQLGLVSLLGKKKNVKIDDQLHALAGNPDTFAAVRDEAYNILLNQNKL
ncbi:MAG: hypothetical protein V4687_07860 [Bacteroidota bacterium]